eukprot:1684839-Rhodomonas_salina.3
MVRGCCGRFGLRFEVGARPEVERVRGKSICGVVDKREREECEEEHCAPHQSKPSALCRTLMAR